jgi:anaerobic sulfite reductase subunit C
MDHGTASVPTKRMGVIEQRQEGLFVLRLHAVAGDFTANQIRKIADVAEKFGKGQIHLSTRQGIVIHHVQKIYVDAAIEQLESAGIGIGASGATVRIISACPGNATCKRGVIETKEIARLFDERFFGEEVPHRFKISVTGCLNNCAKVTGNDIGVMGGVEPRWQKSECFNCGACVCACPAGAIDVVDNNYVSDKHRCTNCGTCVISCPNAAWTTAKRGFKLWLGGTMGNKPRMATKVPGLIDSKDELLRMAEKAVKYYRAKGRKTERFGHTLDRIGVETALWEITK